MTSSALRTTHSGAISATSLSWTASRPSQTPSAVASSRTRAPARCRAADCRRARADRARAARRRRALGVRDGRAGVGACGGCSRTTAPRARRAALGRADGREALTEMRRMLGVMRDRRATRPLPSRHSRGSQHLDALIAQVEAAGLPVTLRVEGERPELSPGVDLSAYRIVQEGSDERAQARERRGAPRWSCATARRRGRARDHRRRRGADGDEPGRGPRRHARAASRSTAARSTPSRATAAASSSGPSLPVGGAR